MTPRSVLLEALKKVPAMRFPLAVAGASGVVVLISLWGISPQAGVVGFVFTVVPMVAIVVFATLAKSSADRQVRAAAHVMLWACVVTFNLAALLVVTALFFYWPPALIRLIGVPQPGRSNAPHAPEGVKREFVPEFPWPPPESSARTLIPDFFLRRSAATTLSFGDVDRMLVSALNKCGYVDRSYYSVPRGFAIVTRLERMELDGTPKPTPDRWALESGPIVKFNLEDYLRALFTSPPGLYRLIVFIVTDQSFASSPEVPSPVEAIQWLEAGLNRLPPDVQRAQFTGDHACTVLIYQFRRGGRAQGVTLDLPSHLPGQTHLVKAGLWDALRKPQLRVFVAVPPSATYYIRTLLDRVSHTCLSELPYEIVVDRHSADAIFTASDEGNFTWIYWSGYNDLFQPQGWELGLLPDHPDNGDLHRYELDALEAASWVCSRLRYIPSEYPPDVYHARLRGRHR